MRSPRPINLGPISSFNTASMSLAGKCYRMMRLLTAMETAQDLSTTDAQEDMKTLLILADAACSDIYNKVKARGHLDDLNVLTSENRRTPEQQALTIWNDLREKTPANEEERATAEKILRQRLKMARACLEIIKAANTTSKDEINNFVLCCDLEKYMQYGQVYQERLCEWRKKKAGTQTLRPPSI